VSLLGLSTAELVRISSYCWLWDCDRDILFYYCFVSLNCCVTHHVCL